ncbi:MAG: enoyl-CoA hydratase [Candidatus Hydrogenedentota bacterium]
MINRHPDGQISTEVHGRIFLAGIDRPEKRNGLTPKMFDELTKAYNAFERDSDLWVMVLFAHGSHFTAGLDLPKFVEWMQSGRDLVANNGVDIFGLHQKCSKPVVCAVQGICFTAGIEMMLACDIVVASADCRFSQLEPKRAISATGGATIRFVQRCGWGNAMYHLLRADEFTASEAYRIGLVQEVVEQGTQLDRAIAIAEEIAKLAPLAVRETKASSLTYLLQGESAAVAGFKEANRRLSSTADAAEGVASFVERREARFVGK